MEWESVSASVCVTDCEGEEDVAQLIQMAGVETPPSLDRHPSKKTSPSSLFAACICVHTHVNIPVPARARC